VTTITLNSDGQTVYVSILNSPATFTVTVTPAEASGTVQFFNSATGLSRQTLSGGSAAVTTSSLAAGNDMITAVHSGDAFFCPGGQRHSHSRLRNPD
jgi:hypothetical protein